MKIGLIHITTLLALALLPTLRTVCFKLQLKIQPGISFQQVRSRDITRDITNSIYIGVQPRQTLTFLRGLAPETPIIPRDIYNQNAQFRRDIRQGHSTTEALIQHLQTKGIKHSILKERDTNRLKGLFIACPESIQYL